MAEAKQINQDLNRLKAFACIMVFFNHIRFPGTIGEVVYTISHLGVPVFFLVSGYYLYDEKSGALRKVLPKAGHIFELLLMHILVYILDSVVWSYISNLGQAEVKLSLISRFSQERLLRAFWWSESIFGDGQWFLIALFECYLVFSFIKFVHLDGFITKYSCIFAGILFFFHIVVRLVLAYNGIGEIGFSTITKQDIYGSASVRNAWFDALPFMFSGIGIHKLKVIEKFLINHKGVLWGIVAFGVVLSIIESLVLARIMPMSYVLYLGTILSVISLFTICIISDSQNKDIMSYIGYNMSLWIFFFHTLVSKWILFILERYSFSSTMVYRFIHPFISLICCFIFSYLFCITVSKYSLQKMGGLFVTVIVVLILFLPNNTSDWKLSKWNMQGSALLNGRVESISESINVDVLSGYSEVMMTLQNEFGETLDSVVMPVEQFIGGGCYFRGHPSNNTYSFVCQYSTSTTIVITGNLEKADNPWQVRVWVR